MDLAAGLIAEFRELIAADPMVLICPTLQHDSIEYIGMAVQSVLKAEATVLQIPNDIIVVGDIHGNLYDLYYVFRKFGMPPARKYCFLGDMVDRGEHSVAVVAFIFALKIAYPKSVFVIRGNHECREQSRRDGFFADMLVQFPKSILFELYIAAFGLLPIAAIIGGKVICVHGGITPEWQSIAQLEAIRRPIIPDSNEFVKGILWSDPSGEIDEWGPSARNAGNMYGPVAFDAFMRATGFDIMIRGHQCIEPGYKFQFGDRLLTLFTSSNYCGVHGNKAAICFVDKQNHLAIHSFAIEEEVTAGRVVYPAAEDGVARPRFPAGPIGAWLPRGRDSEAAADVGWRGGRPAPL